ncbi:MAG TPA: DinB family protein [Longimicrobiales bacterium]|nr:DinB family protein [Longimicrobiales bacterium]
MVEGAANLVAVLEEGFDGDAWHGPNLLRSLRGVGPDEAGWSPGPGRPSIWALTLHCAYWKHRVRQRLTGEREPFPREGRNFPAPPAGGGAGAWRADVRLLRATHASLLEAVRKNAGVLGRPGPGQKRSRAEHVTGIAFHDTYHAGQIRLLRKLHAQTRGGDGGSA